MFGKKKLGFTNKSRTLQEINYDYNHHAAQAGHKTRVVSQLQDEIEQHIAALRDLNSEAEKLPKQDKAPQAAEPTPEAAPTEEVTSGAV